MKKYKLKLTRPPKKKQQFIPLSVAEKLKHYPSPRISSELSDCGACLTFDTYSKCSMSCRYCFSASQKQINPATARTLDTVQAVHPDSFFKMVEGTTNAKEQQKMYKYFFSKRFLLHWGGLADSFCHYERRYGYSYAILQGLMEKKYPLMFSSKGPMIVHDKFLSLFEKYKKNNNVAFQFSIVTADDNLAKKIEPGVPSPTQRFQFMKTLSDMGYTCILRLRPYIIGATDLSLDKLLIKAKESGASALSTEFYAFDQRCVGQAQAAVLKMAKLMGIKDIYKYYSILSPRERGGYYRLNRLVKEPHVLTMYKFCQENNILFACSDPDFKELSQSGCCCALAEDHPNKEMRNWSKNQLTHVLKEARKAYHKTGELREFRFNEIYPNDWIFNDTSLSHQDIRVTAYLYNLRKIITLRDMLQDAWNNLNSYSNPSNYLAGKILPIGLDENKENIVYRYNPLEYEKRWVDMGIDLTQ